MLASPPTVSPVNLDYMIRGAESAAIAGVLKEYNEARVLGLVMLKELQETISMIRHPFKSSIGLINKYCTNVERVCRTKKAAALVTAASDAWLETWYGWAPTYSDTVELASLVAKKSTLRRTGRCRGVGSASQGIVTPDKNNQDFLGLFKWRRRQIAGSTQVRVKYVSGYQMAVQGCPATWSGLLGFNPEAWIATLWELVPYSFIVDYFTNVGIILQALPLLSEEWNFSSHSVLTKTAITVEDRITAPSSAGWVLADESPEMWACEEFSYTRDNARPSVPALVIKVPGLKQVANLIALATSTAARLGGISAHGPV